MNLLGQLLAWLEGLWSAPAAATPAAELSAHASDWRSVVHRAIQEQTLPLIGCTGSSKAADILTFQSSRETGNWRAWYFAGPQRDGLPPTYNLVNRRAGTGRGEWTHQTKDIHGDDTRIYTDVNQAARDLAQLLNDPLYNEARRRLQAADGPGYFQALEAAGFSARRGDYAAYAEQWTQGVYA